MILTDQDILTLLKKPRNGEAISVGVTLQSAHKLHITGEGHEAQVKQVQGFESSSDFNVKKQVSKPATIQITAICLDNLNRWVSSQGTIKRVDFQDTGKNEQFETILSKCWHDQSFEEFIKTFYKEAIYTEFNGFAVVTKPKVLEGGLIEKEGVTSKFEGKNLDPYIIFIAASDVYDFQLTGNKTEYLIISLGKDQYRLIDDVKDVILNFNKEKQIVTIEGEVIHNLGYVPAKKVSNINKYLLNDQIKTSPIDHVIPALDRYFSSDSDLRMQFIKHNYPKLAIVTRDCKTCGGVGHSYQNDADIETKITCNTCSGTGREIPISRDGVIALPQYLQTGDTAYPGSPATYITPDNDSLRLALEDLKQQREDIIYSATGDKNLIAESLNTATENSINNRSLEDRISEITSMVEQFEVFLKKCIKDLHNEFKSISKYSITVKYGRRITTKGESDLLKEIKDAKDSGMPFSYIQGLHKDLIYTKYKNNEDEYNRYLILADVEPLPGYSFEEMVKMSEYLDNRDIEVKANFDSLIDDFETENINVQYFAIEKPYKERVSLIKEKLYEILQKQHGRPDWDRGEPMGSSDSERTEDSGSDSGTGPELPDADELAAVRPNRKK